MNYLEESLGKLRTKYLAAIVLLFLFLESFSILRFYSKDEAGYIWALSQHFTLAQWNFAPPIGFMIYQAGFFFTGIAYARFIPLVFAILSLLLVYKIGNDLFGGRTGLYAALIYAICYYSVLYSQYIDTDPAIQVFFVLSCLAAMITYQKTGKKWLLLASGVSLGLLELTRISSIIFIVPLTAFLLMKELDGKNPNWLMGGLKDAGIALGIALVMVAGWIAWDRLYNGGQNLAGTLAYNGGRVLDIGPSITAFIMDKVVYGYLLLRTLTPGFVVLLAIAAGLLYLNKKLDYRHYFLMLWVVFFGCVYFSFSGGDKVRYMTLTFPAMAMLAASAIEGFEWLPFACTAAASAIVLYAFNLQLWGSNLLEVSTRQVILSFVYAWIVALVILGAMFLKDRRINWMMMACLGLMLGFTAYYMTGGSDFYQRSYIDSQVSMLPLHGNVLAYNDFGICLYASLEGHYCTQIDEINSTGMSLGAYLFGNWPEATVKQGLIYDGPTQVLPHNLTDFIEQGNYSTVVLTKKSYAAPIYLAPSCVKASEITYRGDDLASVYNC